MRRWLCAATAALSLAAMAPVYAAETDGEARRLFTSVQQAFVRLRRGQPSRLPRPSRTSRSS